MRKPDADIYYSSIGRPSDYWCLLSEPYVQTITDEITIRKDGKEEVIKATFAVPVHQGLYAFKSREARDKFVRTSNSLAELESDVAYPVSHSQAQDYTLKTQMKS